MKVRVKVIGGPQGKFRMEDLFVSFQNEPTLKDVLAEIEKERGIKVDPRDPGIVILVNGRRIEFIGGLNISLKHMDEVTIMPIISGG
ncbi:MAG: MoaD/ThiS family protein [Candidatus Bathyarchaeia archaeon]